MERRGFLGALAGATALAILAPVAKYAIPTLHGDGVTDDVEAIEAIMHGQPVWDARRGAVRSGRRLSGGEYAVSRTIHFENVTEPCVIENCVIKWTGAPL